MNVDGNNTSKSVSYETFYSYINRHLDGSSDIDKSSIFAALENANTDDEDKSTLNKNELRNFLSSLKTLMNDASETLKLAISNTYDGIQEFVNDIKKANSEPETASNLKPAEDHNPPKFPSNEYLNKDSQYQSYIKQLLDMDYNMAAIENAYNMKRDDLRSQLNIAGKPEKTEYMTLSVKYKTYMQLFEKYAKEMEQWQDENLGDKSVCSHNGIEYTQIEKITLPNGQHAYKALKSGESEKKVYYPYWDGTVGGPEVPSELL